MADTDSNARLAVLIDADNAPPSIASGLMGEIARYGIASVKRAYGDWTTPNLKGWKETLLDLSIQPIQQFRYTVGKNASDSALIIDAMDLMHTGRFDGFCLVSSDSDFTRLASRLREQGLTVYGFGERKTPSPFVSSCDKFIYTDLLEAPRSSESSDRPAAKAPGQDRKLMKLLTDGIDDGSDEDGWAHLGAVGSHVAKQAPDFDPRSWGFRKLSDLVRAINQFEVEVRGSGAAGSKSIYVRVKPVAPTPAKSKRRRGA